MKLLTRKEAIERLRVTPSHFSKITNGKIVGLPLLPTVRIGRRQLVRDETLDDWILSVEAQRCSEDR
jgi:hypothetical protein